MKSLSVYILLFVAAFTLSTPGYAGNVVRNNSNAVSASFSQTDSSGCIFTLINLGVIQTVVQYQPPGAPNVTFFTYVNVDQYDQCNSTYSNMFGTAENADFQMNQALTKAHLKAVIPACNSLSVCVDLTIDVDWAGISEPSRTRSITHMKGPYTSLMSRYSGLTRDAQVVGSVFNGSTNLIPNALASGFMGTEQNFLLELN